MDKRKLIAVMDPTGSGKTSFLQERYEAGQLLTGIFYLQPITKNRAEGSALRSLALLEKLCGSTNFTNILLISTFWNQVTEEIGARREREMLETEGFWKSMKEQGAKTERMARDYDRFKNALSAKANKPCISLQIQEELHDGKSLQETMVGLSITAEARKIKEEHELKLEEARVRAQEELAKRDKLLENAKMRGARRQEKVEKVAEWKVESARKADEARINQLEQLQARNRRIKQAELDRQAKADERKQAERQRWQEEQALQVKAARLAADINDRFRLSLLQRESVDRNIDHIRTAARASILRNEIKGIAPNGEGMSDGNYGFSVDRSCLNHWCDICQNPIGARGKISMRVRFWTF
ncbi:hypothetical protein MMC26_001277 [Xylographa opegraphella]|nr:hypothetical protein [Xylographa opegraphella]